MPPTASRATPKGGAGRLAKTKYIT
jgi:hypothetical protein